MAKTKFVVSIAVTFDHPAEQKIRKRDVSRWTKDAVAHMDRWHSQYADITVTKVTVRSVDED